MAGDEETGACVMRLTAGLDSGPIALAQSTPVGPREDFGELSGRLADLVSAADTAAEAAIADLIRAERPDGALRG